MHVRVYIHAHSYVYVYIMCSTSDVYGFNYITMRPLSLGYVLGIRWLSPINLSDNVIIEFMVVFSIHTGNEVTIWECILATFVFPKKTPVVHDTLICTTYTHWQNHVSGNYGYLYKQHCVFCIIYGPDL